jgi:probable rRNA maturation factor
MDTTEAAPNEITVSITRDSNGAAGFAYWDDDLSISDIQSADLGLLQPGDTIVSVNGVQVKTEAEYLHEAEGVPRFELTVRRDRVRLRDPVAQADIQGFWDAGEIWGTTLTFEDGEEVELTELTATHVKLTYEGDDYEGKLDADGNLHWNDGEVWYKEALEKTIEKLDDIAESDDELVSIENMQEEFPIDEDRVRDHLAKMMPLLGVKRFPMDVWFCTESEIREKNKEFLKQDKSTDVLSFPNHEFTAPESFKDASFLKIPDPAAKHLGDIFVCPAYIQKRINEDKAYFDKHGKYDSSEVAGVSRAMASTFSLEERIDLLLIHSVLHLLGHDHELGHEAVVMSAREDEIIEQLSEA